VENSVVFKNNSSINVYCIPSLEYPDTTLKFINSDIINANYNRYFLPANSEKKFYLYPLCDKEIWKDLIQSGVIQFFFLDKKIVDSCNWSNTPDKLKIIKREELTFEELKNNNCTITFNSD